MSENSQRKPFVRWFNDIRLEDVPQVGGKNASLGEMFQVLVQQGISVPNGFALTTDSYWHFVRRAGLDQIISQNLAGLNTRKIENLHERGRKIRHAILAASLPPDLESEIQAAYD